MTCICNNMLGWFVGNTSGGKKCANSVTIITLLMKLVWGGVNFVIIALPRHLITFSFTERQQPCCHRLTWCHIADKLLLHRIISSTNFNVQFSLFINNMFVTLLSLTCFEHQHAHLQEEKLYSHSIFYFYVMQNKQNWFTNTRTQK